MSNKLKPAAEPHLIPANSISAGYAELLLHIIDHPGKEISPLILSICGFDCNSGISEDDGVRSALDVLLKKKGKIDVEDVAFTIFPQQLWVMAQGDRKKLFEYYAMAFPAYQAMNRKANGRGLYFERLTMYGRGPCHGNQLEWILKQNARPGVRRSMAQATTFDPGRDHDATAQLPFPCLQHVTFLPSGDGLVVNAFYATQQVFDKAYGNYLGLAQLGAFMAHELKMPLARLNVIVGVAKLERISKTDPELKPLLDAARACVARAPLPASALAESVPLAVTA
jgi:hypothetical protein